MARYSKELIERVNSVPMARFIDGCDQTKASQTIRCPLCGKRKFKVSTGGGHNSARCWACGESFNSPIDWVMHENNLGKAQFPRAVEIAAEIAGILLVAEPSSAKRKKDKPKKADAAAVMQATPDHAEGMSFCRMQLEGSGLTEEDVMVDTVVDGTQTRLCPFRRGRFGEGFESVHTGDDMLIYYYGLDGQPMTYLPKGKVRPRPYVRVRWANPDIHVGKDGKAMKYQTPPGAASRTYIPEAVRRLFKSKSHIETLYLQEGEKKAEKACKHGLLSMGLQGINNFGSRETGLLEDIQDIARVCTVRNIVLLMDSDWDDLQREIAPGDKVDKRSNSFAAAVIKFKQFMGTLHNINLDVEVWWGHVNHNEVGNKGVDDLLCGTLKGNENAIVEDADKAMHSHNGVGRYLSIHKITALTDIRIRDFWKLNDPQAFYEAHGDRLGELSVFKFGSIRYKVEDGRVIPASRYSSDTDIYVISKDSKDRDTVSLSYEETFKYLESEGFARMLRNSEDPKAGYSFIRVEDGIVDMSADWMIRDFIRQYIDTNCKSRMVREYFSQKIDVLLPKRKLEALHFIDDNFSSFEPELQRTYYKNGHVEITADRIIPGKPIVNVWRRRIVSRDFKRIEVIQSIRKVGDAFEIVFADAAKDCEFLRYLINTSNTFYRHDNVRELTFDEQVELNRHLVNKITALGYLLSDWRTVSERDAVIAQDHRMGEVTTNQGGSGKSLFGTAIGQIVNQEPIDGQAVDPTDKFLSSRIGRETRNVFIDDVRVNFNFKRFYNVLTGSLVINAKYVGETVIPAEQAPKFIITTNHAINGSTERSTKRLISYVEFSGWYDDTHNPYADFGHNLFYDWDEYQWQLFDNLMAECVMYYFRSMQQRWPAKAGAGIVQPPMRNIEMRSLRQEMSEVFLQWAEEYYDPSGVKLNTRLVRRECFNDFIREAGSSGHGITVTRFRTRIEQYCRFKGYHLNINKRNADGLCFSDWRATNYDGVFLGEADKSNGIEYITVYSEDADSDDKPF